MDTGSLKNLIELGLKPRRGIPGLILDNFSEIIEARDLGWTWHDIAEAIGRSGDEKAMSTAFWRIKKRIDSGKLKVPEGPGKDQQNKNDKKKEVMPEKKWTPAKSQKEEKKESPGPEGPGAKGVRLYESPKIGIDIFNQFPSID